jgi:ornithine carbamoyltransferase
MGQEDQHDKEREFAGFEVNAALLAHAAPGHIVLHCLPAYRGKEIDEATFEAHAETIFRQAENRLHAQKAVLARLAGKPARA